MPSSSTAFPHPDLIGTYRQFGPFGLVYRVIEEGHHTEKGWTVKIEVLPTGERLEYPLQDVLEDPEAR